MYDCKVDKIFNYMRLAKNYYYYYYYKFCDDNDIYDESTGDDDFGDGSFKLNINLDVDWFITIITE